MNTSDNSSKRTWEKPRKPSDAQVQLTSKKPETMVRLNKFIANAGFCSRREADSHIAMGLVSVNGKIVTEMGIRVKPGKDIVRYDDQTVLNAVPTYILLNKPKGFMAAIQGGKIKKAAQELIQNAEKLKISPVDNMGRTTRGLLLFTNDETLQKKLNQSVNVHMLYRVTLDKNMALDDMKKLKKGIPIDEKLYRVKAINHVKEGTKCEIGVEVNSISPLLLVNILSAIGYKALHLDRVVFGGLTKKELPRGNWRHLNAKEVGFLKMMK